ncbi:MAG: EthD family reductase, partial [Candidatus Binataceae bacterium]
MVKAIYFIKRKPGMELGAFREYWLNQHAAVVRTVPALRRYVQSHTLDSGYRRGEPIYDGVAELWYDDTATMRRIAATPQSRAAAADDQKFLDMSN